MCGIAGILRSTDEVYPSLHQHLSVMNGLLSHRGPDGEGVWSNKSQSVGFGHRRLKIIDLATGLQPMSDRYGNTICYNGEIYNYLELRQELNDYPFRTSSDTEVILAAYLRWGDECVNHLRGMFAFAIWDEKKRRLFCARDRFGIKPFYYTMVGSDFYFASEVKALLPFVPSIDTDVQALHEYLVFQFCLEEKTLFKGVKKLLPAHVLVIEDGTLRIRKYWEVYYNLDFDHTHQYFQSRLEQLIKESVALHSRSDVPIGAYVSGGVDSGIIASVAGNCQAARERGLMGFHGKFCEGPEYDESFYAESLAAKAQIPLQQAEMSSRDFIDSIEKIIYHLDYPVAGPGSFPQYHVSHLVSKHRKVVLGGQGGDEIFGGYTRYLIAYFEQCIKAAIDGTMHNGNFVVTYQSIIPNLQSLRNYKPLLKEFWKEGLFEDHDKRYFRLINRSPDLREEVRWQELGSHDTFSVFSAIFNGNNVGKESYFDKMTHFDFKTLLPALLHVEDRMSMAHGVEARVPFLDHPLVEFAATMPADVKFKDGTLKMVLTNTMKHQLPKEILHRKDKMGFPVPLTSWLKGDLKAFVGDIFHSRNAMERRFFNHRAILDSMGAEGKFGRKVWGLLSLELWQRQFHDRAHEYKALLNCSPIASANTSNNNAEKECIV